jgi:hypothetical protein
MEPDYKALEEKKTELRNLSLSQIPETVSNRSSLVDKLFDSYIQLSPPKEPPLEMEWITLSSMGRGGGRSRKPGNIILNLRRLIQIVPDITITAAGVAGPSWLLPFIALHIWNKLWANSKVDLDQRHAVTIYALWKNRNSENKIPEEVGYEKTNSFFSN